MADLNDALNTVLQHATGIWISLDIDGSNVFKLLTLGAASTSDETLITTGVLNIRTQALQSAKLVGQTKQGDSVIVNGTFYDSVSKVTYAQLKSINGTPQSGYIGRKSADGEIWLVPPSAPILTFPQPPTIPQPSGWMPVPYPRHTLHYIAGGNWNNVAGWLKQRKDMGKPVPGLLLCSMGWSGEPLPENAIAAGAMEVIWRDYPGGSGWGNWADTAGSYQAGFDHVAHCRLPGGSLDKTFIQIQNEATSVGPGLANFYHGAFDAAQLRGIKLVYPVFSVGFPPLDFWAGFVDVLRRGRDEGHRFTLHQYRAFWDQDGEIGTDKQTFINTLLNPDICLRHQKIFAALPTDLKHEPVVLTEFFSRVATRIPLDWYRDGVKALNAVLVNDPNLAWAAHWTYGHGGDNDWEVSEIYDEKAAALFEV